MVFDDTIFEIARKRCREGSGPEIKVAITSDDRCHPDGIRAFNLSADAFEKKSEVERHRG